MTMETLSNRPERGEAMEGVGGRNLLGTSGGASSGTARQGNSGTGTEDLMEAVVERRNRWQAYRRVVGNKGVSGVDAMSVEALKPYLQIHWESIKEQLLEGRYQPQPVLRVEIPKADGKGKRKLGIPTVVDRLIQQAVHQKLTPLFDPEFFGPQLWLPAGAQCPAGGVSGPGAGSRRPALGGGPGLGKILRPGAT